MNMSDILRVKLQYKISTLNSNLESLITDTDWLTDDSKNFYYRKIGKIVYLRRKSSSSGKAGTEVSLGTLPTSFYPNYIFNIGIGKQSYLTINNGDVIVYLDTDSYIYPFVVSFIVD